MIKKFIPNAVTLLNLTAGVIALVFAFDNNLPMAFFWVCMGVFFDFWDGFLARKLNVTGDLGVQLDSLSDMVTSGVVPGVVMFKLIEQTTQEMGYNLSTENYYLGILPFFAFIITLASAYRLAKFNIDPRQTDVFIGLPTPANAMVLVSLPLVIEQTGGDGWLFDMLSNPWVLIVISFISAFLLNANIKLFSLKMKEISWEKSKLQIMFLIFSAVMIFFLQFGAIPIIVLVYIFISILLNSLEKQ